MHHLFPIIILALLLVLFLHFLNGSDESLINNIYSAPSVLNGSKESPTGSLDQQYTINGTDRFLWYREKRDQVFSSKNENKTLWKTNTSAVKIDLFHAYEFEFEYSISHLTPELEGADVFCRYFDINGEPLGDPVEAVSIPEYVVNCPKRAGTKKVSVSLTSNGVYSTPVELIDRMQRDLKYQLSMCLSPIYGEEPKWLLFTEMIEHYKLQGFDHFYIYVYKVDEYTNRTINSYAKTEEAEIITITDKLNRTGERLQHLMYRDCTLRSRGESKWSLFSDIDERLTMTGYSGTILDFLENLRVEKYGAIAFRQRWIMKTEPMPEKYEGEKQILEWMPTRRWHNTTSVAPRFHTIKCIIDPKKVFHMWTHYPKMYYGDYTLYHLEPEQGVVRHYRDQNLGSWGTKWLNSALKFGPLEMTNYPDSLMKKLVGNVQQRVKMVYGS